MRKKLLLAAVIALALVTIVVGAAYRQVTARVEGDYFDSDGVRIHYTDTGQGEPVLLVHGFGANADFNWREPGIHDALAADYRVIALDHRGHGLSEKPHGTEHYGEKMVGDVVRLLDHLGIERAHIVGYSMGGFITMKLLTEHPERFLTAAPCGMGWDVMDDARRELFERIAVGLENGEGFKPLLDFLEVKLEVGSFGSWMGNFIVNSLNDTEALADVIRSFQAFEIPKQALETNTVPLLSLVGTEDPLKRGVQLMEGWVPRHEYHYIEGRNHLDALQDPAFIEHLRRFLAEHAQPMEEAA